MGEGGESKKVTFLDPKGGEPVSLSFESGGAATVSGFSSHGPVSPKLTDGFLPGASLLSALIFSHLAHFNNITTKDHLPTVLAYDSSCSRAHVKMSAIIEI